MKPHAPHRPRRAALQYIGAAIATSALLLGGAQSAQAYAPTPSTVYDLPAGASCLKGTGNCVVYPKAAQLENGRLVATFENSQVPTSGSAIGQELPIYKSDDNGTSWQALTSLKAPAFMSTDPQYAKYTSNWTNAFLYTLPQDVGALKKGTLLLASIVSGEDRYYTERKAADPNWKPTNDGDRENIALALYSSIDNGSTWSLQNIIATGGWQGGSAGAIGNFSAANTNKQVDPIWEPYLMVRDNKLVVYYSDENDYLGYDPATGVAIIDPANDTTADSHGQILAHRVWDGTSSSSWGPTTVDIAGLTENRGNGKTQIGGGRPGMTNVVPTTDGKWIITYEWWGGGASVRFKLADDPLRFFADGDAAGQEISRGDGQQGALPFAAGSQGLSWGGSPVLIRLGNGSLAYNASGSGDIWLNKAGSSTGAWTQVHTTLPSGYSRNLTYDNQTGRVVILQGDWGGATASSGVKVAEVDLGNSAGAYYQLVNRKTGQVLGASGRINDDQFNNWNPSVRLEASGSAADVDTQLWHLTAHADGALALLNKAAGRGLAQWGDSTAAGTRMALWVDNSAKGLWNLVPSGDGYYKLQAVSNSARYATAATSGAFVTLQDFATDGSQDWKIVPVAPTAASLIDAMNNASLVEADPVGTGATIAINATASNAAGQPLHANTTAHAYLVSGDGTVTGVGNVALDANQRGTLTLPASLGVGSTARVAFLFRNTAPAWENITVQPVPAAGPKVTVSITSRCVAGKVVLAITITNRDSATVSLAMTSVHGSKTVAFLAAGKTTTQSLTIRESSMPAGTVTVKTTGASGSLSETTTAYGSRTCG